MRILTFLLLLVSCISAYAQRIDQLNTEQFKILLRKDHPRIGLTKDQLSLLPALERKVPGFGKEKEYLLDKAKVLIKRKDIKIKPADLELLLLAYKLTGEKVYLNQATPALTKALQNTDTKAANVPAFMENLLFVSLYYDWGFEGIDSLLKIKIENHISYRVFQAADSAFNRQEAWMRRGNSDNLSFHTALIMASLAIGDKQPELATLNINRSVYCLKWALGAYENIPTWNTDSTKGCSNFFYWSLLFHSMEQSLGTALGLYRYPFWKNEYLLTGVNNNQKGYIVNTTTCDYVAWKMYVGKEVGKPNWIRPSPCNSKLETCNDPSKGYTNFPAASAFALLDRWMLLSYDETFAKQMNGYIGKWTEEKEKSPINKSKNPAQKPALKPKLPVTKKK